MNYLDPVKNFAKVQVSIGYDASATSIILVSGDGTKLPAPATDGEFNLVWWNNTDYANPSDDPDKEIVRCTVRSTDTLTITRGQEGTLATDKNITDKVYAMILTATAKTIDDIDSKMHEASGQFNQAIAGEIFGLTPKTTLLITDVVMIEDAADSNNKKKLALSVIRSLLGRRKAATFIDSDLVAGILTITHSWALSAPYPVQVTIFDNTNKPITPDDITGATNSVIIDLTSQGTLTGTWGYLVIG